MRPKISSMETVETVVQLLFVALARMVPCDPTFQAHVLETVKEGSERALKSLHALQQNVKHGIDWVVGVSNALLKMRSQLDAITDFVEQTLSDQLVEKVKALADHLDERWADLVQVISGWPATVGYILHDVVKLSGKAKQQRIDYWYARGHILGNKRQVSWIVYQRPYPYVCGPSCLR